MEEQSKLSNVYKNKNYICFQIDTKTVSNWKTCHLSGVNVDEVRKEVRIGQTFFLCINQSFKGCDPNT